MTNPQQNLFILVVAENQLRHLENDGKEISYP